MAVFIDGCFWHGCPTHYVRPRTRNEFWASKLRGNVERDRRQTLQLETAGWRVCRFWEHQIFEGLGEVVEQVRHALHSEPWTPSLSWRVIQADPLDDEGNMEERILEEIREREARRVVTIRRSTRKWRRSPAAKQ